MSKLLVEEVAEFGFEFAGVGLRHLVVVIPDREFVAAASDQKCADLVNRCGDVMDVTSATSGFLLLCSG